MVVGAFLPWVTVTAPFIGTVSRNGIGTGDGVITLFLGLIVAALGFTLVSRRTVSRWKSILIIVVSGIAAAASVYDLVDVSNAAGDLEGGAVAASAGTGLYLTTLGAFLAIIGGVMALRSGR
jgi:hypothetical protein